MIQYKKGICTCHGEEHLIVKKLPGRELCHVGNQDRLAERKKDKPSPTPIHRSGSLKRKKLYVYKRKATGEKVFFETIWVTRPHLSWISGQSLGNEARVVFFFHVLGKGSYPGFRLYDKNLILTTEQEHHDWHNMGRSDLLKKDSRWQKVFDLEQELKKKYYA